MWTSIVKLQFVCSKLQVMLRHRQRPSKIDNKDVTMTASSIDKEIIWRVSDPKERCVPPQWLSVDGVNGKLLSFLIFSASFADSDNINNN